MTTDPGMATAQVDYLATALDGVDGSVAVQFVTSPTAGLSTGSAFPVGTTTVSASATDATGNRAEGSFTVTVMDAEAPVIAGLPTAPLILEASGPTGAAANWPVPTISDNVGITETTNTHAPGAVFAIGTTRVTYSATDAAGNRSEVGFDVTVRDTRAPVLAGVPGPLTLGMDESATGYDLDLSTLGITATDLADGPVPVLFRMGGVLVSGTVTLPEGVTVIGIEAVDAQGNAATPASVTITVVRRDQTAPVLNLPDDITIDADPGQATAIVTFEASALDARDGTRPLTIASSPMAGLLSGSAFPVGTTAMLVSAVDNSGNTAFGTFTVTVTDTEAPVLSGVPADIVAAPTAPDGGTATWTPPTATDNVGATLTATHQPGDFFAVGDTVVTYTATDAAGNEATASFTVTITAPIIPGVVISGLPDRITTLSPLSATITFSTAVAGFDAGEIVLEGATLTSFAGAGATYQVGLMPTGEANVALIVPQGAGLDGIGVGNARAEARVTLDTSADAERVIGGMMDRRARALLSHQPDLLDLLRGTRQGTRADATVTHQKLSFGLENGSTDIYGGGQWISASGSVTEDGATGATNSYLFIAMGRHWSFGKETIAGVTLQFDHVEDHDGSAVIRGGGWLAGPYFATRLGEHPLYLDGRLLYGRTRNDISPLGTFTDSVSTERWLATMRLSGTVDLPHSLTLRPKLDLEWTRDTSEAYVDSLGVPVSSQTVEHRSLSVGLDWRKEIGLAAGDLTLDGGIAFDLAGTQAATGRVDLGVLYLPRPGETISLNLFADGLGGNTRTTGIELSYGLEF